MCMNRSLKKSFSGSSELSSHSITPFGVYRLVTIADRIEFHTIRMGHDLANQRNECTNAAQIGRAVIRREGHTVVILDRRFRDHRGKPATTTRVGTNKMHRWLREPLLDAQTSIVYGLDSQVR